MQNLQAHAPEMKEIQQRWKHDRQRQNEELMKFYRDNKINPAASCLPIVLQIPIFISLFYVLNFESTLPTAPGLEPRLPRPRRHHASRRRTAGARCSSSIYVVSQLTSSYFMSATMQKAQRIMLMVLPVVFIPFILNFPSGLMIYWLTTNLWTTGQGVVTRRMMPQARPRCAAQASSRTPPKDDRRLRSRRQRSASTAAPTPDGARPSVAGPPRRVKRKRSGGGKRR